MKVYKIPDQMYGANIILVVNCDYETCNKLLKEKFNVSGMMISDSDCGATITTTGDGKEMYFIWLSSWRWDIVGFALLAHECYHLVNRVMDHLGIAYHLDADDTQAYYLSLIYGNCLTTLKPKVKGKK